MYIGKHTWAKAAALFSAHAHVQRGRAPVGEYLYPILLSHAETLW